MELFRFPARCVLREHYLWIHPRFMSGSSCKNMFTNLIDVFQNMSNSYVVMLWKLFLTKKELQEIIIYPTNIRKLTA